MPLSSANTFKHTGPGSSWPSGMYVTVSSLPETVTFFAPPSPFVPRRVMLRMGTSAAAVPAAKTSLKELSSPYLMGRFSTFQPKLRPICSTLSEVTLSMTLLESGTTRVMSSAPPGPVCTPMKALVLNSSISSCLTLSRCSVMP